MMTIWRTFYIDEWSIVSASHLVCRHRVSLAMPLPAYYREKIRSIPGVTDVIPLNLFDADYKGATPDDFSKIGTDPQVYLNAYPEYQIPAAFAALLKIPLTTLAVSLPVAGVVAIMSAALPAYTASRVNIVQGLRHIG